MSDVSNDSSWDIDEEEVYSGYSEDDEVEEIKGITDSVTDYTYTNLDYPCIVFNDGVKLEKHKIQVISNMLRYSTGTVEKDITVYFNNLGQLYKMGMLGGVQLSSFLDIVGMGNISVYLEKGKELRGSMIYALCCM